jgi:hypothetical protein
MLSTSARLAREKDAPVMVSVIDIDVILYIASPKT